MSRAACTRSGAELRFCFCLMSGNWHELGAFLRELPGRVLIQTYHPHHYALRHACAQDYEGFFEEEINYRRNLSYPPFVALASLLVHGVDLPFRPT